MNQTTSIPAAPKAAKRPKRGRFWSRSALDAILVAYVLGYLIGIGAWLWYFDRLPLSWNFAIGFIAGFGHFHNYIVANHEFMHTPPFRSRWLNLILNVTSSVTLVYWMSLIEDSHKLHHLYNNDPKRDGETKDPTSTYMHGKQGKQEHVIPYIFKNFFRASIPVAFFEGVKSVWNKRPWPRRQFIWETFTLATALVAVIWINPWFLVPMFYFSYFGWILTDLQNYYEHYRASNPESRYANSVSHYGKLYNILMFNEGYHQEHHIKPTAHWTERPAVREKYRQQMADADHYISPFPMVLGFLDRNPPPTPRPDTPGAGSGSGNDEL